MLFAWQAPPYSKIRVSGGLSCCWCRTDPALPRRRAVEDQVRGLQANLRGGRVARRRAEPEAHGALLEEGLEVISKPDLCPIPARAQRGFETGSNDFRAGLWIVAHDRQGCRPRLPCLSTGDASCVPAPHRKSWRAAPRSAVHGCVRGPAMGGLWVASPH